MHFGRVKDLTNIDLTLPPDTVRTARFLGLERPGPTKIYVGCPIWASKNWVGSLYPQGTKASEFLRVYAQHFNTVEVNSTFYHLLDADRMARWRDEVPPDFRFCPKVYRGITENLVGEDMPQLVEQFCEAMRAFGDRLGLVFAQFPETLGPRQAALLAKFVHVWPEDVPLAVELRHPGWFREHGLHDDTINFFYRHKIATVITDTPGRRDVLHLSLTQPKVLIRFQGNELHPTDRERLVSWAERLTSWKAHHLDEIYFFAHQPDDIPIPQTADILLEELVKPR